MHGWPRLLVGNIPDGCTESCRVENKLVVGQSQRSIGLALGFLDPCGPDTEQFGPQTGAFLLGKKLSVSAVRGQWHEVGRVELTVG